MDIRKPGSYTKINAAGGNTALPSTTMKIAIVAPMLASGSKAANVPVEVFSPADAGLYWGKGSILHRMIKALFRAYEYASVTGVGVLDDAAGVPAAFVITLTGTATGSGTFSIRIGADKAISVAVPIDATPTATATRIADEINKYVDLAYTASNAAGVITLTAKNDGTPGNWIGKYNPTNTRWEPELSIDAAGQTVALTSVTAGSNDPDCSSAYAALAGSRYHLYVIPFANVTAAQDLDEHLANVSDEVNQKGARGYLFVSETYAAGTTISAVNEERLTVGSITGVRRPSYENAAAYAAIEAKKDKPWYAVNGEELIGCDTPEIKDRFTFAQINNYLFSGVTPFEVGPGEKVVCVRSVSTYTENASGTPDVTFLDFFKIAVLDYLRDAIVASHARFRNMILRDEHVDNEAPNIITVDDVDSNNFAVAKRIEKAGGLDSVDRFANLFISIRDPDSPGRINSQIPAAVVDAAHVFNTTINIVSTLG